ncbi:DPY30 domain-containing protein 1-like [Candoia aspera]|uniref:DPY30 domain-containing protein 1-like n=1 Tax=Candoia aspera TaxID=51853 RepID=UPI002FD81C42
MQSERQKVGTDIRYLKENLGTCLAEGLAEVADHRPVDPIRFLASWICSYNENRKKEEKEKTEKDHLEFQHEEFLADLERTEELKAEELLMAQKFEERQKMTTKEKVRRMPEEYETKSTQEALENTLDQVDLNVVMNELDELSGKVSPSLTLQEALLEIAADENLSPKVLDDRGEDQLEQERATEKEHDIQAEDDTQAEKYRSAHNGNSE